MQRLLAPIPLWKSRKAECGAGKFFVGVMVRAASFGLFSFAAAGCVRADTFLVLPFFNVSKTPNLDWIGESLSETVREALAAEGIVALERVDREEAYRRLSLRPYALLTRATVIKAGQALDAEQVVYGTFDLVPSVVTQSRGTIRFTANLLDLKHLAQGPEFREEGPLEDLAAIESRLAWHVLRAVNTAAAPSAKEFQKRHPPVRVDAVENYVRGLLAAAPEEKHRFFTQAVRLDNNYSQPCFELGRLHWQKQEYRLAAEWLQRVAAGDVHFHEASFLLGLSRYHTGDFAGAQAAFQKVEDEVPLSEVYNNLGAAQSRRNLPQALENFRKALEGDSSDPDYHFNTGYALWKQGDFSAAAAHFETVLSKTPEDPTAALLLSHCRSKSGSRPGDTATEGLERLKNNYEESAYLQLRALVQGAKP